NAPFTIEPPPEPLRVRLQAEQSAGIHAPLQLDFVGCLRAAAENSRDWQDRRERLFRTALALTLQRWNFSVQPSGTATGSVSGSPGASETEGGLLSDFGLFKLLGIGTRISANAGLDLLEDLGRGDAWNAISHLSLNITQPLFRGFGPEIVREPLT